MNAREQYISDLLDAGKLRPKPGHLLAEKLVFQDTVKVDGLGEVSGTETASGLVVISNQSEVDEAIRTKELVVRRVGADVPWKFRWFGKERDWKTSWAEQRIEEGVVIGIRAVAGIEQDISDRFIEVRYDEISAIAQFEGEENDKLPAPGWVMLDVSIDPDEKMGKLYIKPELQDVLENNHLAWGTITALPRGYSDGDLAVGMEVGFDRYKNQEYMMLEGNVIRCMPMDEILCSK